MAEFVVRRIVVACDVVGDNETTIEAAARLAALWHADLHGLFLEDVYLLDVLALPVTRQVGQLRTVARALDADAIEHHFAAAAGRASAALAAAAGRHGLAISFEVIRGKPSAAALPTMSGDLLVMHAGLRAFAGHWRPESRWARSAIGLPQSVLLARDGDVGKAGVTLLLQRLGAPGAHLIGIAAGLAEETGKPLAVLAAARGAIDQMLELLRAVAPAMAADCRVELVPAEHEAILRALAGRAGQLVVIDADPGVNEASQLRTIARRTEADLLLVR